MDDSGTMTQLNGDVKEPGDQQAMDVDQTLLKECQTLCELTLQRMQEICKTVLKVCYAGASGGKAG